MVATSKEMREWLRAQGETVGERGRLHPNAVEKYRLAHQAPVIRDEQPEPIAAEVDEPKRRTKYVCGFCLTGVHKPCPGRVPNGSLVSVPYTYCKCAENEHKGY